ncbi:D-2-hydroxyacid dehydrogenase [Lentilactobacillus farraginis]|uniref:D-lactate dehydrogenase n=1 Tax=Lentilactobacillus farraginis DSM 18382 = JCM 14108 TaxID=1423743 RepID=X0PA69_9LACO|nr:D-2-hydroxyacid dehydrogenase [Lentilactobacillus farraginis]KRM10951.1 D-lactate dehydrogenase [Lentilactobacillus farraginis DSM 18382 = JCM 14108]GAF36304.1 D-lactate dehydrogenase [Lentilactobacillus farraginis DSM 18382 = JCM 14108]
MTKILAYHVRDDEQAFIDEWASQHQVQVDSVSAELHDDTVDLANGYDGVDYKQRSVLSTRPDLYRKLHGFGIKQLAARSAGIDSVNLTWAKQNGLKVTNVPSYSPPAVAELVLTQAMQLIRHIPQFNERLNHNDYIVNGLRSRELSELTVGIIGVGRIGGTVAKIFHALGATVLGNDITAPRADLKGILTYTSKEELFSRADIVTVHVYYAKQNYHLIGEKQFDLMKTSAFFINDSRGPVVNTNALLAALHQHQLAGAALDVVEHETNIFNLKFEEKTPEPLYNALKALPNVLLTPHIGFFTDIAVKNMVKQSLDDTLALIEGRRSDHEIAF